MTLAPEERAALEIQRSRELLRELVGQSEFERWMAGHALRHPTGWSIDMATAVVHDPGGNYRCIQPVCDYNLIFREWNILAPTIHESFLVKQAWVLSKTIAVWMMLDADPHWVDRNAYC